MATRAKITDTFSKPIVVPIVNTADDHRVPSVSGDNLALYVEHIKTDTIDFASPRIDWPTRLRRTFEIDVLKCPTSEGDLEIQAVVTEREAPVAPPNQPNPRTGTSPRPDDVVGTDTLE